MQIPVNDIYVVVPAYNEASSVHAVVREIRERYPNVVVVDDGSSDETAAEALRANATVLRHVINRGQGAALQTAIEFAVQKKAAAVATFDADGQHRIEDVARMVEILESSDADIVIGSRFLDLHSDMPWIRRLLLKSAAVFMRLTSGVALTDAHNGLRVIRRSAAERIHLTIDGMAHASEFIDQIYQLRLRVIEVPVVVRYSEYSLKKGQSSLAAFRIAFDYLMKRIFR